MYNYYWQKAKKEEAPKHFLLPTCGIVLVVQSNTKRGGKMNITVNLEIDKREIENFQELERTIYRAVLRLGREITAKALESLDDALLESRDASRYRCKGFQGTCAKTIMGAVEYKRRVYLDNAAVEGPHCVHLLDEVLDMKKIGLVTEDVCKLAATAACETSYRAAAKGVTEATGLSMSAQGVWNIVQRLGETQKARVERHAELAQQDQGVGALETKLLYEENDGIWLKLQGKDRQRYGKDKEMKVGIAYPGVRWMPCGKGKKRRILDNKVAYATFDPVKEFRRHKEGLVASRFDTSGIDLRIVNGDGAQWIQKKKGIKTIAVLDKYHRNKKITECAGNGEFADNLRKLLYAGDTEMVLTCIEAQINSLLPEDNPKEIEKLQDLYSYFSENKEALLDPYKRGIEIPETYAPGEIHHARLGSMESNVFTLLGNRMKGRRRCWSISGGNNMALLLSAYHTSGFENMFADLPGPPKPNEVWKDTLPLFGASKVPEQEGHGYDYCHTSSLSAAAGTYLSELCRNMLRASGNNF